MSMWNNKKNIGAATTSLFISCFNMSKSERIIFLSYNNMTLTDIDNFL